MRMRSVAPPQWPSPLAVAEAVPPPESGTVPLFLYGTLMDEDVLRHLLRRDLGADRPVPARLRGFRRVAAANADYPVLVPDPDGEVDGVLLRATAADVRRINHCEDDYRAALFPVAVEGDGTLPAWVYLARPDLIAPDDRPWDPELWRRYRKADLFARIDEWMADFVER